VVLKRTTRFNIKNCRHLYLRSHFSLFGYLDPENGGSKTLRNVANLSVRHDVIPETLNFIQTSVRTSSRTFFIWFSK